MNLSEIGEFGLIARLKSQLATREGVQLGIGDDAAILEPLQCPIITMDALVESVHFRRDWTTPCALGRKAMAVNISDLAASGARPVAAFVSLALGKDDTVEWVDELYAGFEEMAGQFNFTVAGGDTVKSLGGTMISVALVGEVIDPERGPVLRSGAKAGDVLMVSGTLGDSAAGLALLIKPESSIPAWVRDYLLQCHREPTPRLDVMRSLLGSNPPHAALDISDGVVGDAAHMARSSGLRLEIDAEKLPISKQCLLAAKALGVDAFEWALTGGEDYELLIAVAPADERALARLGLIAIGRCVAGEPVVAVLQNGVPRDSKSAWTHF